MRENSTVSLAPQRRPIHGLSGLVVGFGLLAALVGGPVITVAAPTGHSTTAVILHQTEEEGGERSLSPDEMTRCLLGVWMHSMEEDTEELLIYRPGDYPFPPAHGRTGFEFIAAGYLVYHGIGPADEPEVWNGRWELVARNRVDIEVNQDAGPDLKETLHLVSCSEDLLEIAR